MVGARRRAAARRDRRGLLLAHLGRLGHASDPVRRGPVLPPLLPRGIRRARPVGARADGPVPRQPVVDEHRRHRADRVGRSAGVWSDRRQRDAGERGGDCHESRLSDRRPRPARDRGGVFGLAGWRPGRAWLLLGLGLGLWAIADTTFVAASADGNYTVGGPLDTLWMGSALVVGFAAWQPIPAQRNLRAMPHGC